ncbi:unnamed protein product, partial [Iphiclides podalirius]
MRTERVLVILEGEAGKLGGGGGEGQRPPRVSQSVLALASSRPRIPDTGGGARAAFVLGGRGKGAVPPTTGRRAPQLGGRVRETGEVEHKGPGQGEGARARAELGCSLSDHGGGAEG